MASGYYPKVDNPAHGHVNLSKAAKELSALANGWQAYTPEQITAIFDPGAYASMSSEDALWIQPATVHDRARLEARAPTGNAQPIFRNSLGHPGGSHRVLPQMGATKRSLEKAMLHYLGRCV